MECQVNIKSQSELDIGGRETCFFKASLIERLICMYMDQKIEEENKTT